MSFLILNRNFPEKYFNYKTISVRSLKTINKIKKSTFSNSGAPEKVLFTEKTKIENSV